MFCESCGSRLRDDAQYCPNCGAKVNYMSQTPPPPRSITVRRDYFDQPPMPPMPTQPPQIDQTPPRTGNAVAIVGFVLSMVIPVVISVFASGWYSIYGFISAMTVGVYFSIAALVCSIVGLVRAKRGAPHRGLALAGVIVSAILLAIVLIALISVVLRYYFLIVFSALYR